MIHYCKAVIMGLVVAVGLGLSIPGSVQGEDKRDMGGWEIGGAYNKLYDAAEFEAF
jgi:hypothetical protein